MKGRVLQGIITLKPKGRVEDVEDGQRTGRGYIPRLFKSFYKGYYRGCYKGTMLTYWGKKIFFSPIC